MIPAGDDAIEISGGKELDALFPGYYPPSREERRDAYRRGLISVDTNALLDLYRFTEKARHELFEILETLSSRLFITHQAALEFYRNRLSVFEDRLSATDEKCKDIQKSLDSVSDKVQEFAGRHQIAVSERDNLTTLVNGLSQALTNAIRLAGTYDLTREQVLEGTDAVLKRLEALSLNRIGSPLNDDAQKQALKEAARRREERIPPGYSEKKTVPGLQAGDYILWRQLMSEASAHGRPVLFVTNEQKEDWVLKDSSNRILGPRPELVLEMQQQAGVALHTVTVVGLLREAREYLGISVSSSTIHEAESIPRKHNAEFRFTDNAMERFDILSTADQGGVLGTIEHIKQRLGAGDAFESLSIVRPLPDHPELYYAISSAGSILALRIRNEFDGDSELNIDIIGIFDRQSLSAK